MIVDNIENWRLIDGYDNYEISSHGRCRNNKTSRILKPNIVRSGYYFVSLRKDKITKRYPIHRLVAFAFLENPLNKKCVDHIDRNQKNNMLSNLRWATLNENQGNRSKQKNTTSIYKGVYWNKKNQKWKTAIYKNGKQQQKTRKTVYNSILKYCHFKNPKNHFFKPADLKTIF